MPKGSSRPPRSVAVRFRGSRGADFIRGSWTSGACTAGGEAPAPLSPQRVRAIGYAQAGHLRIGYTSGYANLIALLYDRGLTNELVPLHYRNCPVNHGREFATAAEFLAHVRSLDPDYIQILDPHYPGADLPQRELSHEVWVWDRASGTNRPFARPAP